MNKIEVLTKEIQNTIDRGWLKKHVDLLRVVRFRDRDGEKTYKVIVEYADGSGFCKDYRIIIFSPDFAEARWGTEQIETGYLSELGDPWGTLGKVSAAAWQYHLQRMLVAHDTIKYLGEHLPK